MQLSLNIESVCFLRLWNDSSFVFLEERLYEVSVQPLHCLSHFGLELQVTKSSSEFLYLCKMLQTDTCNDPGADRTARTEKLLTGMSISQKQTRLKEQCLKRWKQYTRASIRDPSILSMGFQRLVEKPETVNWNCHVKSVRRYGMYERYEW